jgi:carbon-monoxide dehydrogenase medium subunit
MTPSAFDYVRPSTLPEALAALSRHGDAAKLIAGGHSLLPMMKLRMAAPEVLIDINELADLHGISIGGSEVVIGAATTHATLEHHKELAAALPLIAAVAHQIADPTVRNRGTIGGAIANADPSADWPAAVLALDAVMDVIGPRGKRTIAARDFFKGLFETALGADEVLVAVRIPVVAGARAAYRKFRHPSSGYAVAGIAVVATVAGSECKDVRIAATGLADHQFRVLDAEAALKGKTVKAGQIDRAVADAFAGVTPLEDRFANARYRLQLGRTMLRRALSDVFAS